MFGWGKFAQVETGFRECFDPTRDQILRVSVLQDIRHGDRWSSRLRHCQDVGITQWRGIRIVGGSSLTALRNNFTALESREYLRN